MTIINNLSSDAYLPECNTSRKGTLIVNKLNGECVEVYLKVKTEVNIPKFIFIASRVEFELEAFKIWLKQTLAELEK